MIPNPSTGVFYLIPHAVDSYFDIEVRNNLGQLVKSGRLRKGDVLNISDFPNGIYYFRIIGVPNFRVEKLVKSE